MDYKVLARKYRPKTLSELVGQNTVCDILRQAFSDEKIPHAFILHGIRGVGKTTIARILAKGLNCFTSITVDPCGMCASCIGVQEGRHLDVVEMDAASRTSVDDIREIIESSRYKPVLGRYKIFIIDEVHMLSKNAFNALLKTLEEPPPHVKFIFATTEIRKIPDTILSRCIRLELKRINPKNLLEHLEFILKQENEKADLSSLKRIVQASEGSLRDALSILDQAISLAKSSHLSSVSDEIVRKMLGSLDRDVIFSVVHALGTGESSSLLLKVRDYFDQGLDPLIFLQDLLDIIYTMTCFQQVPSSSYAFIYTDDEVAQIQLFAQSFPPSFFLRAWNVLISGYQEVDKSPLPYKSMEMLLLRLCFLKTLPPLEDMIQGISSSKTRYPTFESCLSALQEHEPILSNKAKSLLRIISYQEGKITTQIEPSAPLDFIHNLKKALFNITKHPWIINVEPAKESMMPFNQVQHTIEVKRQNDVLNSSLVKDALKHFPGATVSFLEKGSQ